MEFPTSAVVRVALEPSSAADMGLMLRGLRRLRAADLAVEFQMESTGECILSTAGEVHLERCLDDLQAIYAPGLQVTRSAPIVPFRETIIPPPEVDMVNETIEKDNATQHQPVNNGSDESEEQSEEDQDPTLVVQHTADHSIMLHIRAVPLPVEVGNFLEQNVQSLKSLVLLNTTKESSDAASGASLTETAIAEICELKEKLAEMLKSHETLSNVVDSIIAFGPRHVGPNMLINVVKDYNRPSVWRHLTSSSGSEGSSATVRPLDHSILHGFQLATLAGPLCEEPMHGICFLLEEWTNVATPSTANGINHQADLATSASESSAIPIPPRDDLTASPSSLSTSLGHSCPDHTPSSPAILDSSSVGETGGAVSVYGPISGQLMSAMKEACRRALLAQPPRIMTAMYSCEIHVRLLCQCALLYLLLSSFPPWLMLLVQLMLFFLHFIVSMDHGQNAKHLSSSSMSAS